MTRCHNGARIGPEFQLYGCAASGSANALDHCVPCPILAAADGGRDGRARAPSRWRASALSPLILVEVYVLHHSPPFLTLDGPEVFCARGEGGAFGQRAGVSRRAERFRCNTKWWRACPMPIRGCTASSFYRGPVRQFCAGRSNPSGQVAGGWKNRAECYGTGGTLSSGANLFILSTR